MRRSGCEHKAAYCLATGGPAVTGRPKTNAEEPISDATKALAHNMQRNFLEIVKKNTE